MVLSKNYINNPAVNQQVPSRKPLASPTCRRLQLCCLVAALIISMLLCYIGFLLAFRMTPVTFTALTVIREGQAIDVIVNTDAKDAKKVEVLPVPTLPAAPKSKPKTSGEHFGFCARMGLYTSIKSLSFN